MHKFITLPSPVGELMLVSEAGCLIAVLWPEDHAPSRSETRTRVRLNKPIEDATDPILIETKRQLNEYFAGTRQTFTLPIRMRGTEFQQSVWETLRTIPFGTTATYAAIAQRIERPRAVRAVGAANSKNPISIIVPCHRVVGSNGTLTGFAGGIETKRQLLQWEADRIVDQS